jgi:hypothetical protein
LTLGSEIWTNHFNANCWSIMPAITDSLTEFASRIRTRYDAWYERFYFAPANPAGLAICRIWLYGYFLYKVLNDRFADWAQAPAEFWKPLLILRWLPGPIHSLDLLLAWQTLLAVALACCVLGVWIRYAAPAVFFLSTLYLGLPQCFGNVSHSDMLFVLALGVFALSNSADSLSLAARRRRSSPTPSGEYRWPIALIQTLMCVVFFAAGVAKLRSGGLAWVFSDHMQNSLLKHFYGNSEPPTTLGPWLAQYSWMCQALAGLTVFVECAAPLALFSRHWRWLLVPVLFGMQIGIHLALGHDFELFRLCYLFWLPWGEIAERAARLRPQPADEESFVASVQRRAA